MSLRRTLIAALFLLAVAPAPARADGFIVPFFGVNFGGDSGRDFGNAFDESQFNYGVSIGWMGGGIFGAETDISYSPDFFGKSDVGGSSLLTFMGNLMIGVPFGGQSGFGIRPYGVAGVGLVRSDVDSFGDVLSVEENQFGWNFGGGVVMFFGNHFGVRGDIRYFRAFDELDFSDFDLEDPVSTLDFTRGSIGVVFRF